MRREEKSLQYNTIPELGLNDCVLDTYFEVSLNENLKHDNGIQIFSRLILKQKVFIILVTSVHWILVLDHRKLNN
jgi:hypothetical protein